MLPRSVITRPYNLMLHRTAARRLRVPTARFQSTSSSSSSSSTSFSYGVAGVAGAATVILAGNISFILPVYFFLICFVKGYAWYHTSTLRVVVQKTKEIKASLKTKRDSVVAKMRETPSSTTNTKDAKETFADKVGKKAKDLSERLKKDGENKA